MEPGYENIHKYVIDRCREGDRKAQYELYKLYAGAMLNICRRMMSDMEEAKDVLQEAFTEAFLKLSTYKGDATFGAWLKRIVINKCINALRKRKMLALHIEDDFDLPETDDNTDEEYIRCEAQLIMKAIDKISDGCKVVLNLYLFEGYDHKEIAEILSITEAGSKAQYSKAKKKIRDILAVKAF